jgi:hypothetical protein
LAIGIPYLHGKMKQGLDKILHFYYSCPAESDDAFTGLRHLNRNPPPVTAQISFGIHFLYMEEQRVNTQVNWAMMVLIASIGFVGCQGTGQTVNFDPHASPSSLKAEAYHDDSLTILVEPFRDNRPQKNRIGSRTHFWGGATHFNVWTGNVSEGMANLAVEYLQQRKWQASRSTTSETGAGTPPADVILTGDIVSIEANAKTGFGFTDMAVKMRVGFEATNVVDGSTVKMVLGANGTHTVATFNPKDVEELTNEVAKDLFNQLFQDLTVKNKAFHLKSDKS